MEPSGKIYITSFKKLFHWLITLTVKYLYLIYNLNFADFNCQSLTGVISLERNPIQLRKWNIQRIYSNTHVYGLQIIINCLIFPISYILKLCLISICIKCLKSLGMIAGNDIAFDPKDREIFLHSQKTIC